MNTDTNIIGGYQCCQCGGHGNLNMFQIDTDEFVCEHCMFDDYAEVYDD